MNKNRVFKQTLSFRKLEKPKLLFIFIFLNRAEVMVRTTVFKNIPLCSKPMLIVWFQDEGTMSDRMTAVLLFLITSFTPSRVCWMCLMEVLSLGYCFSTTVQVVKLSVCQFSKTRICAPQFLHCVHSYSYCDLYVPDPHCYWNSSL